MIGAWNAYYIFVSTTFIGFIKNNLIKYLFLYKANEIRKKKSGTNQ